jgi:hypothetical protein
MELHIVNPELNAGKARLIEPTASGYIYLGGAVRHSHSAVVTPNARRSELLQKLKSLARKLETLDSVVRATVFRAIVMPPTTRFSAYLKERGSNVHVANFDVMMLIETKSADAAREVQASPQFRTLVETLRQDADGVTVMAARNIRRMGDVDTSRKGLFLFNHFAAEDPAMMVDLWDHLAGWYARETGLDNSVALAPTDGAPSDYAIVNWARWDSSPLRHFWSQLSKKSFWKYVTANLDANHAASMPIYCRLA